MSSRRSEKADKWRLAQIQRGLYKRRSLQHQNKSVTLKKLKLKKS